MLPLPHPAGGPLSADAVRAVDRHAIETLRIPGIVLMENAARSAAEVAYARLRAPASERVVILCGGGNNGGDGYAVARHLSLAGVGVSVIAAVDPSRLSGDAQINATICRRMGIALLNADAAERMRAAIGAATMLIDALLGTGARGAPRGCIAELIRLANQNGEARKIAIDIPSGLEADSGGVFDPCFRADATVTFVAAKLGFAAEVAAAVVGEVIVVGIGAPHELVDVTSSRAQ